ncbi:carbohydrate sulfotransferase 14-like [Saccoglossus kowalevskii]|uniref:Carbohydrate sulfotransferase n=1 Tax=Saccoglossus kowalevskii TaxID=10224 RepID=A0ABM0GPZ1_SACKO|nr:PREDICTED: carbohydrate sulfotransferase 14-like [Saccoglossus kowalevskii]
MLGTWTLRHLRRKICLNVVLVTVSLFFIIVLFSSPDVKSQSDSAQVERMVEQVRVTSAVQPDINLPWETRSRHLEASCKNTKLYKSNISSLTRDEKYTLYKQIIVNDKYKFLYCFVPKVACSNWKRVIKVLDGYIENIHKPIKMDHRKGLTLLSDLPEAEADYKLKHYYKFMFSRQPLTRMLSAYRNKFTENIPEFREKIGHAILLKYRHIVDVNDIANMTVTFSEFVQYVIDSSVSKMDIHWKPMHDLCQPCSVRYDFIGTLENIESDTEHVLNAVGADNEVEFPKRQKWYKPTTPDILQREFATIPAQHIENLVKKYETDFDLFSYHVPDWL